MRSDCRGRFHYSVSCLDFWMQARWSSTCPMLCLHGSSSTLSFKLKSCKLSWGLACRKAMPQGPGTGDQGIPQHLHWAPQCCLRSTLSRLFLVTPACGEPGWGLLSLVCRGEIVVQWGTQFAKATHRLQPRTPPHAWAPISILPTQLPTILCTQNQLLYYLAALAEGIV